MKVAKNISDGIDFGRSLGGVAYIYIYIYTYIYISVHELYIKHIVNKYEGGKVVASAWIPQDSTFFSHTHTTNSGYENT